MELRVPRMLEKRKENGRLVSNCFLRILLHSLLCELLPVEHEVPVSAEAGSPGPSLAVPAQVNGLLAGDAGQPERTQARVVLLERVALPTLVSARGRTHRVPGGRGARVRARVHVGAGDGGAEQRAGDVVHSELREKAKITNKIGAAVLQ